MATIVSENIALAVVKLVASRVLPALVSNLVMGNIVNRDYEGSEFSVGSVVNVPIAPPMAANNIAETGTVTAQAVSLGNAQVTLNSHVESSFVIPDVTRVLTNINLIDLYAQSAMIALAEKIESDLFSLYVNFQETSGATNAALSESAVDTAETKLFTNKCPATMPKYLILHPTPYATARNIARFSENQTIGTAQAIMEGTLPKLKGFSVARSQLAPYVSSVYHGVAICRDTMAMAIRRLPAPLPGTGAIATYAEMGNFGMRLLLSYNASTLAQQFTADVLYGASVVRKEWGVDVLSNG